MIKLDYFTRDDIPQLIDWIRDERLLMNWAGSLFSFPLTERGLEWYIEDTNVPGVSEALLYKAIDTETGKPVGHISIGSFSQKNRSGRISRVLVGDTESKGKGVCQAMVRAIARVGFDDLKLHRISLGVYDFNTAAIRCYEKAGFRKEGVQRDILQYKEGEFWSLLEMSLLEDEWRDSLATSQHK
jgi:RimJ/RimL family protein N-acetyltransferase